MDWLYPPVCAGCGIAPARFCPQCLASINRITLPQCPVCGNLLSSGKSVCEDCAEKNHNFSAIASWAEYTDPLRSAIHAFKYKNDLGLGDLFACYLVDLLKQKKYQFNVIVPVPLSNSRRRKRGFNQSLLLARPISLYFHIPLAVNALRRIKETDSQVHLNAMERETNMEGAFCGNPATLKGKDVLLVDDIITTGATMNHCASSLLTAGARSVYGISLAKTILATKIIDRV